MLEHLHRELLNFLTRQVGDRHLAADLAQESYVRVLGLQHGGQAIADPRALLYRIARHLVIDQHRRNKVRRHESLEDLTEDQLPMAGPHLQPDEMLATEQQVRRLVGAIEALPLRCREAFVLNRFDGLTHQQVAKRMGISRNMVVQHVVRAVLACEACLSAPHGTGHPRH